MAVGARSRNTVFCRTLSLASFDLECQGEQGGRPGVGEVLAGVLFEFAKPVMDGVAVDVELLGSSLGRAVVVEPGLEGFEENGTLFVGEVGEPGEGGLGEVVHHLGGADCGGSKQIPIEDRDAAVRKRAGQERCGPG